MSVAKEAAVKANLAKANQAKRRKLGSSKKKGEAANTSSKVKVGMMQRELWHLQQQVESFETFKNEAKANESALAEQIRELKEEEGEGRSEIVGQDLLLPAAGSWCQAPTVPELCGGAVLREILLQFTTTIEKIWDKRTLALRSRIIRSDAQWMRYIYALFDDYDATKPVGHDYTPIEIDGMRIPRPTALRQVKKQKY